MHFLRNALSFFVFASLVLCSTKAEEPKTYTFAKSPLDIIDIAAAAKFEGVQSMTGAERELLEAFWKDRTSGKVAQADDRAIRMHLLASGVTDPKTLDAGVKRFNDLVAEAKKALENTKTPQDKADKLLRFLHAGVMAKGYDSEQSRLDVLFEKGQFNCVSSSGLYYLVGHRLSLDLKGIVMRSSFLSGHVAIDLVVDGKRIELEPTNADGYDWPEKLKKPGVISFSLGANRSSGHDVDGFGIAACIATNHAITAAKADTPRFGEALRFNAIALDLLRAESLKL